MIHGLALCAGIGGIELGIRRALAALGRRDYRCAGYVEREAFAVDVLVQSMAAGLLDEAPVWSDASTFPGHLYRGRVDLISAGFPCQPWSFAGRRAGTADVRWIWPSIVGIIRDVGPRIVFLENVPGLLSKNGLATVLGDLAELRFDAEWLCLSASDVGANHGRKRIFILAYSDDLRRVQGDRRREDPRGRIESDNGDTSMADPDGYRREGVRRGGLPDGEVDMREQL